MPGGSARTSGGYRGKRSPIFGDLLPKTRSTLRRGSFTLRTYQGAVVCYTEGRSLRTRVLGAAMFPRDPKQAEGPDWMSLGTFAGGALAFVRELLQGEGVTYREEPRPGQDGVPRSELWVVSLQHDRARSLLGIAQADAEAAAYREAAVSAAERSRAA